MLEVLRKSVLAHATVYLPVYLTVILPEYQESDMNWLRQEVLSNKGSSIRWHQIAKVA
jgi:hypothetical protein